MASPNGNVKTVLNITENSAKKESKEELTFVLIGALGSGKSSTGNSILGHKQFKVSTGTVRITNRVERKSVSRNGLTITVVDTPGLEDVSSFSSIKHEIDGILHGDKQTNIIYLIIIKIGRYTKEEKEILDHIFKNEKPILKNAIIVFTNRSDLIEEYDKAEQSVDEWIQKNPSLSKRINDNKLRYRAFENKRSTTERNDEQVKDLIDAVGDVDKNDAFTCDVSGNVNMKMKNTIFVDKKTLGKKFGEYGLAFFEEQKELQINMKSSTTFECPYCHK